MSALRRLASPVVALAAIVALGVAARLPSADLEPAAVKARFAFRQLPIVSVPVAGVRRIRQVEPKLRRISAWISSVGAAVALADVDGNGRADDVCLVDPRTDTITVSPAPGTRDRFAPFVLDPAPLRFDRSTMAPMGCLPGDFDEDGRIDLLAYYWGRTPVLFLRRGHGRPSSSSFVRRELVPGRERWYTDSIDSADVDGDGHADLIVGNYFPDGARVLDPSARRDPAMQMQDSMSHALNGGIDRILLWQRSGRDGVRFREARRALAPAIAKGWTLAVGAYDLNGDLRPELYFANDFGPDRLLLNESRPGRVRLRNLTGSVGARTPHSKALGRDSFKGMGIDFADLNGDGRTDMFVSNITTQFGLQESNFAFVNTGRLGAMRHGAAPFVDRSESVGLSRSGWGWDAKFGDFDADGTPELVQATGFVKGHTNLWPQIQELAITNDELLRDPAMWPRIGPGADIAGHQRDAFFVRDADGRWGNVASLVGLEEPFVTRGVATADVNGDGRLDFAVANQWERSYLYLNHGRRHGKALELRLLLRPDGRVGPTVVRRGDRPLLGSPAVGAAATVVRPGRAPATEQVDGGNGHASVRSPELFFGLGRGAVDRPLLVRLAWRDRTGHVRHAAVRLRPGRYTILLGEGS